MEEKKAEKEMSKKDITDRYKKKTIWLYIIIVIVAILLIILCATISKQKELESKAMKQAEIRHNAYIDSYEENINLEKDKKMQKCLSSIVHKMQPKLDLWIIEKMVNTIVIECKSKGLDPILITALIWVESGFDPLAHSEKEAAGLMQIRYNTWKETSQLTDNGVDAKNKLYWIESNIKCGTSIFKKYYDESGRDIVKTLWRYNSGQTGLPKDVQYYGVKYANKILIKAYSISDSLSISGENTDISDEPKGGKDV